MTQQTLDPGIAARVPDVVGILDDTRRWMRPAMREAADRLHPGPRQISGFTFGWREADGTPRDGDGGKGVRPALAGLAAVAAGGAPEDAAPGAVAVEFVHAFSLVHDDIMDGDELRRHRQTAWKAYGVGAAVLAGDGLLALALDTLARSGNADAVSKLTGVLVELVNGQAADTAFEERSWSGPGAVTVEEYTAMAIGKTASLLGCAASVGWLLGGGDAAGAHLMDRMGRHLGLAFQAVDDVLGIWGDPAVTGKAVYNDLRQGKKSLPVVAALGAGVEGLAELLADRPDDEARARRAAGLIEKAGGRRFTEDLAERELAAALAVIDEIGAEAAPGLRALAEYVVRRRA
ncbi:polyprenyl synthetase family protein [Actinocorallia sp. A-T 12471]|uniref:polyprenyl synthetase family protein n=1 Tax=Actinocorallia sp. A-T 12471 TaxID=3089813 RepID=UPI0029D3A3CD|nr:polyprenyl synthetase family protein [Actinocorallia sp. A-T 12471]MDX6743292.1 polyprenyl synthetase family protein [Actinocorallia sp. A-T 12471]